jgi:hypothetical protein
MAPSRLQLVALVASIVLAAASAASLLFGVWTYRRNANAQLHATKTQLQLTALGTLQHYFDLAVEHPELASPDDRQPVDARYAWFAGQALYTAQTLRTLVGDERDWQAPINLLVRNHRPFLHSTYFRPDDFDADFVDHLRIMGYVQQ